MACNLPVIKQHDGHLWTSNRNGRARKVTLVTGDFAGRQLRHVDRSRLSSPFFEANLNACVTSGWVHIGLDSAEVMVMDRA